MVVQHNLTAMNSNRMLGLTTASQAKSTERLSSGYKINRAADDAAGLSISEKMRKQIRGLTQASSNAQDGISAVQTAEGALNEVQDMLQRMNELAVKASNGTMSENDRSYVQDEVNQLVTEIDRVSETTKFNETYLLKGNGASANAAVEPTAKDKTGAVLSITSAEVAAVEAEFTTGALTQTGNDGEKDAVITVSYQDKDGNLKSKDVSFKSGKTVDLSATSFISALNADEDLGALFDAAGDNGGVTMTAKTEGTSQGRVLSMQVKTAGTDDVTLAAGSETTAAADAYKTYNISGLVTGTAAEKAGQTITVNDKTYTYVGSNGVAHENNREFNSLNSLKDALAADGVTLGGTADTAATFTIAESTLELKLHVGADSTDENQIGVKIDAMDASSLGLKTGKMDVDGVSTKTLLVNGTDDANAKAAIDTIADAIQKVSTQRSALGAVQNRLEHTINNLDNIVENTTSAESAIRDTDMATEMVKYSNNNILSQAGQAMLAQANQSNQGVLSLLQ